MLIVWKEEIAKFATNNQIHQAISVARKLAKEYSPDEIATYMVELGIIAGKMKQQHDTVY